MSKFRWQDFDDLDDEDDPHFERIRRGGKREQADEMRREDIRRQRRNQRREKERNRNGEDA